MQRARQVQLTTLLLCLCCTLFTPAHPQTVSGDAAAELQSLWSSRVQVFERLAADSGAECRNHTRNLLASLKNATFWALQMLDSSANIPSGILEGSIYNLGDFDECISVDNGNVQGQYCLASLTISRGGDQPLSAGRGRPVHDALVAPDSFSNAWSHIQNRGERWRAPRDTVKLAICVPRKCSHLEVQAAMHAAYFPKISTLLNASLHVEIPEKLCSTYEPLEISDLDVAFVLVVGVLLFFVSTASFYEYVLRKRQDQKETSLCSKIFLCFSARKHFVGLSNVEKESETDLNFLFGIRFLSILAVIACHKAGFTTAGPVHNPNFQEQSFSQLQYMFILHGDLVVDTFFFLAGFLLTVGMMKVLRRPIPGITVSVWPLYIFRFLRLTPAYMLTILFYASLLPKIGSGPLWKVTVVPESEYCVENWWANLAYVNNYVRVDRSCIEQGWYMPCDMHLFIVCAPLVLLVHRRPKLGAALLALFTFASVLGPLLTIWVFNTDAMLLFFLDFLRGSRIHPYFSLLYVKSHVRGSPYFIGVIIGLIYMRRRQTKLAKAKSLALLLIGFVIGLATSLSGALFYHTEGAVATSAPARAFYGALHRPAWALSVGLIVLAIALGRLSLMRKVLGWKPLVPLSKLSYGAYLIHVVVLWYSAGTAREPTYNNAFIMILNMMGDCVVTFAAALLLYLLVEAPIRDMAKLALSARISMDEPKRARLEMEEERTEEKSSELALNAMSTSVSSNDSGVCDSCRRKPHLIPNYNKETEACSL